MTSRSLQQSERERLLRELDVAAQAEKEHWFAVVRELALHAYFSSEIGLTQAMRYALTPGRWDACVPLEPGQPAWGLMRAFSGLLLALLVLPAAAETFRLRAPAETLEAVIRAEDTLTLEVRYRGKTVARTPALGLEIDGHLRAGSLPRLSGSARRTVDETIRPAVPEKRAVIPDRYNELRLSFGPKLAVTFRAYDDGVAYRFETAIDGEVIVRNESAGLRLGVGDTTWIALVTCRTEPGVDCFQSSHEENYQQLTVDAVPDGRLAYLPITVQTPGGYVVFTESDLRDYPGLWLRRVPGQPALAGDFARYPLEEQVFGGEFKQSLVTKRADFLARTSGNAHIPVARADGVAGCCRLVRQRPGLPAGQSAWSCRTSAGSGPASPPRSGSPAACCTGSISRAGSTPQPTATTSTSPPNTAWST